MLKEALLGIITLVILVAFISYLSLYGVRSLNLIIVIAVGVVIATIISRKRILNFLLSLINVPVMTIIHELGHALMASLLGYQAVIVPRGMTIVFVPNKVISTLNITSLPKTHIILIASFGAILAITYLLLLEIISPRIVTFMPFFTSQIINLAPITIGNMMSDGAIIFKALGWSEYIIVLSPDVAYVIISGIILVSSLFEDDFDRMLLKILRKREYTGYYS